MRDAASRKPSVGVVMAVRNEEKFIASVLKSLDAQELIPTVVVVVDDGSTDGTRDIMAGVRTSVRFDLVVVPLVRHRGSYMGRPQLASVLNVGLRALLTHGPLPAYVMKLDGDHPLPNDYLSRIVGRMEEDPRLGVVSGRIEGERYAPASPRGSGMVARTDFWERANGMRFPLEYGWESWLYLRAQAAGYETRSFPDIVSHIARPTSFSQGFDHGRGMYALGYFWPYVLGRCAVLLPGSPRASFEMLRGFVDHRGVRKLDVSAWVTSTQRRALVRRGAWAVTHLRARR